MASSSALLLSRSHLRQGSDRWDHANPRDGRGHRNPGRRGARRHGSNFLSHAETLSAAVPRKLHPVSTSRRLVERRRAVYSRIWDGSSRRSRHRLPPRCWVFPQSRSSTWPHSCGSSVSSPLMGGAAVAPSGDSQEGTSTAPAASEPGSSVGVGLVTGDLQISAAGTVTHVDPDNGNVYAFGHPALQPRTDRVSDDELERPSRAYRRS